MKQDTFNDDNTIVLFDNVVNPETFNDGTIVTFVYIDVKPHIFNADNNVELCE